MHIELPNFKKILFTRFTLLKIGFQTPSKVVAKEAVQLSKKNLNYKVSQLEGKLSGWLGDETKMIKNKAGDPVFLSNDSTKRIRFDFNNPHGDKPHMHIEKKINSKWKDASTQHRIYPFED